MVEKGVDSRCLGVGGWGRYIIIQDGQSKKTKKYVNYYGHAFAQVGTYTVKKRGFNQYPLPLGEHSPSELRQEIERRKTEKQKNRKTEKQSDNK